MNKATPYTPEPEAKTLDITHYERGMSDGSRDALAGRPSNPKIEYGLYLDGYCDGYKQGEHTRRERVQRRSMP